MNETHTYGISIYILQSLLCPSISHRKADNFCVLLWKRENFFYTIMTCLWLSWILGFESLSYVWTENKKAKITLEMTICRRILKYFCFWTVVEVVNQMFKLKIIYRYYGAEWDWETSFIYNCVWMTSIVTKSHLHLKFIKYHLMFFCFFGFGLFIWLNIYLFLRFGSFDRKISTIPKSNSNIFNNNFLFKFADCSEMERKERL